MVCDSGPLCAGLKGLQRPWLVARALTSDRKAAHACAEALARRRRRRRQEFFLVPRDAFARRPDLQLTGRTVMGRMPARGQEMSDHYMAPVGPHVMRCMQEIQAECFRLGIPLRTRHREVPPRHGAPP